ncbi:hypothetical protein [Haloarcula sp. JP-L23]|uniref:hypothetical protein n=1 Tax=Haloarcula sp. JP-L23 TaxID=2716717 RepID=UPI00140EC988|nr:hypothetical protein G9465_09935 [Haloarcula sp. JP-L23]
MTTDTIGVSVTNSPVTETYPATVGPVRTSDRDAIVEEARRATPAYTATVPVNRLILVAVSS